jgi:hypothetical protein
VRVARPVVWAHPHWDRRRSPIIRVCGFRFDPFQPPHLANSFLESAIGYFDAHGTFRNFGMRTILEISPGDEPAFALSPLFAREFEKPRDRRHVTFVVTCAVCL